MHDWTLVSISLDWASGLGTLNLLNSDSQPVALLAHGVLSLNISRFAEWGRSVSINSVIGPVDLENGRKKMQVEIQSGDLIEIVADSFILPF